MKNAMKVLPALLLLCAASAVRAQTAPAPGARASVASVDAINKLVQDLGLPLPSITDQLNDLPFAGKDMLATDKPIGVIFLSSDALPSMTGPEAGANVIIVVPLKQGKGTDADLKAAGAVSLDDKPGIYKLGQFNIRKLGGNLLVQTGSTAGLAELKDSQIANDYKQAGNLAVVTVDLQTIRKMAPQGYKGFIDQVKAGASTTTAANVAEAAGQRAGQQWVLDQIDTMDKLTLAVAQDDKNLHIRSWSTPFDAKASTPPKALARPAFPKGILGQMHIVYPSGDSAGWLKSFVDILPAESFPGMKAADIQKNKQAALRFVRMFTGDSGLSLAMSMKNGKPVFYLVSQFNKPADFTTEFNAFKKAMTDGNDKTAADTTLSTYDDGGKKVTRLTTGGASDPMYIDAITADGVIYYSLSPDDGKYVKDLAAAGLTAAKSATMCAGVIDLSAIIALAEEEGVPLPAEAMATMKKDLAGQGITWTVQAAEGNTLYIDIGIPKQLIKDGVDLYTQHSEPTPPPPGRNVDPLR